jgi:hypothetical protein
MRMKCHWEKCLDLATMRLRWLDDGAEAVYCDAHAALARQNGAALAPANASRADMMHTGSVGAGKQG